MLPARRQIAWAGLFAVLIVANGLLIFAFGMGMVPASECVTHRQMAAGISEAVAKILRDRPWKGGVGPRKPSR